MRLEQAQGPVSPGRKRSRSRRAFTLLELLLVVGILVMLAAIAVPNITGQRKATQIKNAQIQINSFEEALELYHNDNDEYPSEEQGLFALIEKPEGDPPPKSWNGPYLRKPNFMDPWGMEFNYRFPGENNKDKPDIWSSGPDKTEGTEDDITNWETDADRADRSER